MASLNNDVHTFHVTADDEKEGCLQLGFRGKYKLQVGISGVRLIHHITGKQIAHWPIEHIRNYGHSFHSFFLESGRRCETGEGKFIFSTLEGCSITNFLKLKAEHLRKEVENKGKSNDVEKCKMSTAKTHSHQNHTSDMHDTENYSHIGERESKSISPSFPPIQEQEEDYYSDHLYSHLNQNDPHRPENVYGFSSASAPISLSEGIAPHKKTRRKVYENVNL